MYNYKCKLNKALKERMIIMNKLETLNEELAAMRAKVKNAYITGDFARYDLYKEQVDEIKRAIFELKNN